MTLLPNPIDLPWGVALAAVGALVVDEALLRPALRALRRWRGILKEDEARLVEANQRLAPLGWHASEAAFARARTAQPGLSCLLFLGFGLLLWTPVWALLFAASLQAFTRLVGFLGVAVAVDTSASPGHIDVLRDLVACSIVVVAVGAPLTLIPAAWTFCFTVQIVEVGALAFYILERRR